MSQLPIQSVLPQLLESVRSSNQIILKAEPGAGKSTYFPLQLLKTNAVSGKIVMLEPRRLAARNIATYLSEQLGEKVGQTVGYRVRNDVKVSAQTRLEIVTEGIMTNMLQADPELTGIDLLIFDEFHERSIHADIALAFSLEIQEAFRDDLKIVVMSATLDQQALQTLLPDADYIESEGRSYPVEVRYAPLAVNDRLVPAVTKQINSVLNREEGSVLVFLPGMASIKQTEQALLELKPDADICPLYGQLSIAEQEKAICPSPQGRRKVVLATNIAETSLTIEGIRIVVDSGLERTARFDPKTGITRLDQVKVAQSSAIQRTGRAGRLQEGLCIRLYSESQFNQQPKVPEPEILHSDLSSLAMELAVWGTNEVNELSWMDVPPKSLLQQGRDLLHSLGLLNCHNQPTERAKQIQTLGIEPRLGAMLLESSELGEKYLNTALALIPLLEEPERNIVDITHSLYRLQSGKHPKSRAFEKRASLLGRKLSHQFNSSEIDELYTGVCLAFAYPDRIGKQRGNRHGSFLLANRHGAFISEQERLAEEEFIVAIDLMRTGRDESQLFLGASLDIHALKTLVPQLFFTMESVDWDEAKGRLIAQQLYCLGNRNGHYLVTGTEILPQPDKAKIVEALLNYLRRKGLDVLNWDEKSSCLRERIRCASDWLPEKEWPSVDSDVLLENLESWLEPYMTGVKSARDLKSIDLYAALTSYLGWPLNQEIDELLPVSYQVPTGSRKKIVYQRGKPPVLSVRMQEMFGEQDSPVLAQGRVKITLELLSPAQRPLQVTADLAGFWAGAYKEVQKEMKGRYPKHPWPDDPANHIATTKTKRQLNS
ncbi:ATP-dependent helicase HrpB [Vibrio sp. JC009]|uniref:ATP-dependent helicase HrpB n=1 Tax=Vibrio sp. JC009 TaxID=2912314 RepID=UPI0023AEE136|nr:ATP-dependent helicase HrpB [Vibrio sp. JC009]WED22375.1 ATP-dependent helicase HrpB [Vibrio sp. JC009]